ncbi:hypothetical protein M5D96_010687 [Drosophila gunungcola]|uniref:Uncharacterized protein n=1 Tax=Drosophila gunungcola TaxID=103775 RepID=A0A9P9YGH0_9MUSC|nr:hypothetical protein M5D96_010687 [Drosophila gunungcola]
MGPVQEQGFRVFQISHTQRSLQGTIFQMENESNDAKDYLTLILLNAILPPVGRTVNRNGKRNQKPTIADAQLSMIIRLRA